MRPQILSPLTPRNLALNFTRSSHAIFQPPRCAFHPRALNPWFVVLIEAKQRGCLDRRQLRQYHHPLLPNLPHISQISQMSDIRYHILEMWYVWWDFFRRDTRNHWRNISLLVLADAITRILGLDASCGLNPLLLFPLFLYSLGLLAGVIEDTYFQLTEKLTGDAQNKSNPPSEPRSLSKHNAPFGSKTRTNRQRPPQRNRKYKRIYPSQGNPLAKGTPSSQGNSLWWNQLKQGWRATLILLLAITVCSILIPGSRNETHQRLWILLFGHLLAPFFNFISYLYFELMEDLPSSSPSKDNPSNGGQRHSGHPPRSNPAKLKRKAKRKPPSPGNRTLKGNHSTKGNRQSETNPHSNGNNATSNGSPQSNAPTNYLARFAPEIRLQIFKHYFTAFRPERIYQESHYKGHYSENLLNALHDGSNQRQYEEALEQYQKASHLSLLLHGADVGKDFVDNLEPSALSSLKELTFGPR
jgi:hypothetical protein